MTETSQNTPVRQTKTFPFEPPPGLGVNPLEAEIILFAKHKPGLNYGDWPKELRIRRKVEPLVKKGLLRRAYFPDRYFLTIEGFNLAVWLTKLFEHHRIQQTAQG